MSKISVGVEEENWKKLMQLKIDKDLKTFDDVINFLLKKRKENKGKE